MHAIILYLIKLSCSLSITWLFYRLVLRSLTFYTMNRWYLLGYSLLSFFIPCINIGSIYREDPTFQPLIRQYIPVIDKPGKIIPAGEAFHLDLRFTSLILLAAGSCLLLIRFFIRWYSLRRLRRQAILMPVSMPKRNGKRSSCTNMSTSVNAIPSISFSASCLS